VKSARLVISLTLALVTSGLVAMTFDVARRRGIEIRRQYAADPATALALRAFSEEPSDPAKGTSANGTSGKSAALRDGFRQGLRERQRKIDAEASFTGYLQHRVSPLGNWPASAAALFWCAELVAASLTAAWAAWRVVHRAEA
jgi:hypothetical protein